MITSTNLLSSIPAGLRDPLFKCLVEVRTNFAQRRWEPSELNGGKFCEVVYTILLGALKGSFPAKPSKPLRFAEACRALEGLPASAHPADRSLRVLIPRVLVPLYEIRNNRGVGHVGGDVDPNHMDATVVLSMTNWVMAELIRIFHGASVDDAQASVESLVEKQLPNVWSVGTNRRVLTPGLKAADQALLLLYSENRPVSIADLIKWIEYSNPTVFRAKVLEPLHKQRRIEFDSDSGLVTLSPAGIHDVEGRISRAA